MSARVAAPAALLGLGLAGCHRVTGVSGYGGEFRHGHGYDVASQVIWWAASAAVVGGLVWLVLAAQRRARGASVGEEVLWGASLLLVGGVAWLVTSFFALGLWICHGSC